MSMVIRDFFLSRYIFKYFFPLRITASPASNAQIRGRDSPLKVDAQFRTETRL